MPKQVYAKLIKKEEIIKNIYKFSVKAPEIVENAKPGNFIEIRVTDGIDPFLRRPISIYNLDKEKGILEFIFQVKGKGTEILAKKEEGNEIDIIGPLGHGTFKFDKYKNIAVIGGGIGIFPLYELSKQSKQNDVKVNCYLGFRNQEFVMLEKEFEEVTDKLIITTDDGTYKNKGFAIDYLKDDMEHEKYECIYACGPLPMLRAVQKYAIENNVDCQLSLEEKMACGLGVCLGCAVKTAKSPKDAPEYWHVCKGGPVFNAKDVEI